MFVDKMSAKIDIISDGYANMIESNLEPATGDQTSQRKKFMKASCSSCLVRSSGWNVVFDTLGPWEKDKLIDKLATYKIHPTDIDYLVCSHTHPDHIGNANLFTKAKKHFLGTSVYTKDEYDLNCFEPIGSYTFKSRPDTQPVEVVKYQIYEVDKNLAIEPTPGHTLECISMIVKNCEDHGQVALAGDLFEREEDLDDDGIWLGAGSQNSDLQRAHRDNILKNNDFILPGHGPMFKVRVR